MDRLIVKLAIYIRVSSPEQAEGYSLEAQENACRQWAAENGHEVVRLYTEPGLSARTDKRPEFQKMITSVKIGIADGVLIHKSDRIARNLLDQLSYMAELEAHGRRVFSVLEPFFNDDSPENRMVVGIVGAVNQFYSANLSREVRKGQEQAARSGRFPGGRLPVGYIRDDEKNIIPDPDRAEAIANAFVEFSTGNYTLEEWTSHAEKLVSTLAGMPISFPTWGRLFRNVFYIGQFKWRGDIFEGDHQPLVDNQLFQDVQELLDQRNSGGSQERNFWLLAGLVWSNKNHSRMTGSLAKGTYAYYRAKSPGRPEHLVPAGELEERVILFLGKIRGTTPRAPESWRLALAVAPSVAALWPLLTTDRDRKVLLNTVFLRWGIVVEAGGAISEVKLQEGFDLIEK